MPFITIPRKTNDKQISFEDVLFGASFDDCTVKDTHDTRTIYKNETPPELMVEEKFNRMMDKLKNFVLVNEGVIKEASSMYHTFQIPKKSGGRRTINAPNSELSAAQRGLKTLLEREMFATYHTAAFAYVKGRSTVDALQRHQQNNSKWFLKLDFHDFFGSTTMEFVLDQLKMIYPFNELMKRPDGERLLKEALSICFLNGGLPQGTPISPMLTNLIMIPVDYALAKMCREHSPHLRYTRYADDMLISSDIKFRFKEVVDCVKDVLQKFNAPFTLNDKKTRFGSSAGSNWNLGLMLNKDNQITVGNENKKKFKTTLYNMLMDYKAGIYWSPQEANKVSGILSYYRMVEKDFFDALIAKYDEKTGIKTKDVLRFLLSGKLN